MEQFLVFMERNEGRDEAQYSRNTKFYDDVRVDISAIRVRAHAIPDNEIAVKQLGLLADNIDILEKLHKIGMNRNDIQPIKNALNMSCSAILKLELAKKRGNSKVN